MAHPEFAIALWRAQPRLLLIVLAIYAWQRRSVPGALVLAVACSIAAPWAAGATLEVAAVYPADKIFWFKFQAAWQSPAITALTCFVLEYAWPGRWLTRRNLVLLSIPSLLIPALIVTDNVHRLLWRGFTFAVQFPDPVADAEPDREIVEGR